MYSRVNSVVCDTLILSVSLSLLIILRDFFQTRQAQTVSVQRDHEQDEAAASECEQSSPKSSWIASRKSSKGSSTWSALKGLIC